MRPMVAHTAVILLISLLLLSSCSSTVGRKDDVSSQAGASNSGTTVPAGGSAGPSDDVIKSVVEKNTKAFMARRVTMDPTWETRDASVNSVELLRKGEFKEGGGYLPVQARVSGTLKQKSLPNLGLPPSRDCKFDGTGDFRISKDDYGDWRGQIVGDEFGSNFKVSCGN